MRRDEEAHEREFRDAFATLFPAAGRVAMRILGDRDAAEDVAAEALARTYARWSSVRSLPYRDAWVLRVAANLAIDSARRRRPVPAVPRPIEVEEKAAVHLVVIAALKALSRRQRDVVVLRYFSDLTDDEVAATLGIGVGSVKTHMRRAHEQLRRTLGEDAAREFNVA